MSLWFNLQVNNERVATVEIRRLEERDLTDPDLPDTWNTYSVHCDSRHVGKVRHRYGDGKFRLLALAAALLAENEPTGPGPFGLPIITHPDIPDGYVYVVAGGLNTNEMEPGETRLQAMARLGRLVRLKLDGQGD